MLVFFQSCYISLLFGVLTTSEIQLTNSLGSMLIDLVLTGSDFLLSESLLTGVAQGSYWVEERKKDGKAFHWCGVIEPGQLSD